MVEIVVALIAAVASIASAAIQYAATVKTISAKQEREIAAPLGRRAAESPPAAVRPETELPPSKERRSRSIHNHVYWYLLGGSVTVVVAVFGAVNPDLAVLVNTLGIIPVCSLLLALLCPIEPAYASLFVTVATAAGYVGYGMSGDFSKAFRPEDLPFVLGIYVLNVVVVAGLDHWRSGRLRRRARSSSQ